MKTVYFVRHGESEDNVGDISHGKTAKLTEIGHEQARIIAERCSTLPVEAIISSGFPRADQTAKHISDKVGKPFEQSDLFSERRHPSSTIGLRKDDPARLAYEEGFWNRFSDPKWRHEDAENFADLKSRAALAAQYLADRKESNIVVVGHGMFMRILTAYMLFGEDLNARECMTMLRALQTHNTGLSILEYHDGVWNPWRIVTWNDHEHLAARPIAS